MQKIAKDSSFTEISVDQAACHPSGLTKLCVDQKLCTYLAKPCVPHLMKPHIWPTGFLSISFINAFGQHKIC